MSKILYAEFTVLPGNEARVREMMLELAGHVRNEPGNVAFVPYTRADNPRAWFVYEIYEDDAAFQAHITAPYGATFNNELVGLIVGDGSQLTWLESVE